MFVKIRGTKIGFYAGGQFIVNTDQIISIGMLGESRILYLADDQKGIMVDNDDFERLYAALEVKDCTVI